MVEKSFWELCDEIDAHCHTGDTLANDETREYFTNFITSWSKAVRQWDVISKEMRKEESLNESPKN